ncbi:MAG TPA: TonB-dependent receptor [Xanthobacteraceae bacterium]|nr:TonB-dependent receptor [Xanthobacteraceae bacterium]
MKLLPLGGTAFGWQRYFLRMILGAFMTPRAFAAIAALLPWICAANGWAQTAPASAQSQTPAGEPPRPVTALPTIRITAPKHFKRATPTPRQAAQPSSVSPASPPPGGASNVASGPSVPPTMASQMTISGQDLNRRAVTQPGQILEAAPGLAVVSHADGGKANQYYLRGYNLDHGTDFAVFVDDMPINLPTHAHGQGYADLNWLMPETVNSLDVRKGPYFADVGDFASAGSLFLNLRDSVPKNIVSVTAGSFDYERYFGMGSTKLGGGSLLYAGETNFYNGPWDTPDHMRKFSGLMRYSQGTATDGLSATAIAYSNDWTTTEQEPLRAIQSGQIGLYGEIDPTDGGDTSRYSLSARMAQTTGDGSWKANAYLVKYELDLFNDFTWFLNNPIQGDQFQQHDDRIYGGAGASRIFQGSLFGRPTETVVGFQTRTDSINLALNNTVAQQFLSATLADHVNESNAGIYAENTVHWTNWLSTTFGWRGDHFAASVDSMLQPANSGKDNATIGSPKFRMTIGPFYDTEFFIGAGMGYHSNDARSTVITEVPGDPATPEGASPFLVRSRGAEVGVRTRVIAGLDSSVSLFTLHQDSELFFDGDTGETVAGLPSQRTGVEFTNDYRPVPWMHIDADLALTRARFIGFDYAQEALYQSLAGYPQAQIGNAPGNYVYNAPWMVASAGITLGNVIGWFGDLRWRYISSRPLTEDGVFQSPPLSIFNGQIGYRFENGWRIQLDALNLFNAKAPQAEYAYGSLIKTDSLFTMCNSPSPPPKAVCQNGVMDYALHPIEPLAIRLTLAATF